MNSSVQQIPNLNSELLNIKTTRLRHEIDFVTAHKHLIKSLSATEFLILQYIVADLTNREIARKLETDLLQVLNHRVNIIEKLGTSGLAGLIKFALAFEVENLRFDDLRFL